MEDDACDMRQLRHAALAVLPTPVAPDQCFRMWIPAPDVVQNHNIDEILQSLAGNQPQMWKDARPQVRDFVRIPKHGISFLCTSQNACHKLGGVSLKICGFSVRIKRYSLYDKWYYVDLTRLPPEVDDTTIYNWFCEEAGARPVLIAPKYNAAGLVSRDRTVFFPQVGCPDGLLVDEKTPLREIFFTETQAVPCFVHHRNRKLNKFTPPSLQKKTKPKREIDLSADVAAPQAMAIDDKESHDPTAHPRASKGRDRSPATQLATRQPPRSVIIPRVDPATLSEWKLVENSKRGLIDAAAIRDEPAAFTPCELAADADDFSLRYDLAVSPNYYRVLVHEYVDDATSPDVDIDVQVDSTSLNGFTADSPLLPLAAARALINSRHHAFKVEHMSLEELSRAIDDYLAKDFFDVVGNHDDALASIKAQPAFHRKLFNMEDLQQAALVKQHAVFRAFMSSPLEESPRSFVLRLKTKFGGDLPPIDTVFQDIFAAQTEQDAAFFFASLDLLLMVMAPSIYVNPIKVQMLMPPQLQPRRVKFSAFLLWSDVTLAFVAKSDVCQALLDHPKIPTHFKAAVEAVRLACPASVGDVPSGTFFDQVLRRYQLVALQETKFTKYDLLQSAEYFTHTTDPTARCFWSHSCSPTFTGRHGVGLVLSSTAPFQDPEDATRPFLHDILQNQYLLHIVLGDFNVTLDDNLDQQNPGHQAGTGREDLRDWLLQLGLLDAWRFQNPESATRNQQRKFEADLLYSEKSTKQFFTKPVPDGMRHSTTRLWAVDRAALDAPLTANDFYWAISTSKNAKAPGPDGLPIEYYKIAPNTWAMIYEAVYANQLSKGRMSKFQRRAHLSLLYKAGDRSVPGNYRPLTLLNHDAKLGPKILAHLQRYCRDRHSQAGAVMLDFAKAFDSVLWPALDMTLVHFGFDDTFRAWVNTFYSGTLVSILMNGSPGQPFELGAGVRQGDPLSPGLFVIFIEPMLDFLRATLGDLGVKIDSSAPHLLVAFADDCTGILRDLQDAPRFLAAVRRFSAAAGLKLNVDKTNTLHFSVFSKALKRRPTNASRRITVLSAATLHDIDVIVRNFINNRDQDQSTLPGMLKKEWIYISKRDGGLGLTPAATFVKATHLTCLRDSQVLTDYWYETLLTWRKLNNQAAIPADGMTRQTMPLWSNFTFLFGGTRRPLIKLSKHNDAYDGFGRPASKTLFVTQMLARLGLLTTTAEPLQGPTFRQDVEAAHHPWLFKIRDDKVGEFAMMSNAQFVTLLRGTPAPPNLKFRLQHNALGFRYKYKWHTSWKDGLYGWSLTVPAVIAKKYGSKNITVVANLLRGCVLRSLWLHRNNKMFNTSSKPKYTCTPKPQFKISLKHTKTKPITAKLTHSKSTALKLKLKPTYKHAQPKYQLKHTPNSKSKSTKFKIKLQLSTPKHEFKHTKFKVITLKHEFKTLKSKHTKHYVFRYIYDNDNDYGYDYDYDYDYDCNDYHYYDFYNCYYCDYI
ncbi:hypothetical protein PybrP1_009034 [[Pythium] brassicae (nom. inval.)]|nr:hypothetical protein PybrP1_009034 [[Pythium] brassicae (nom. inval.)]